ncbi:Retrovirus-related Pol polyprotein from transposon 17.6 [Gossypium australe]|uniref:Retrovirus-related Pol polyprotein from transposon 17.6 n=1 Tax=Gossypium australe TaxID=47621 RepID=A0A5B6WU86_9ROSI|nr:Retrovirus-related Pol polyprotein from transposon 17.6 [Gossypium australe]
MYDASDVAIVAVLRQKKDKLNYTTTEKELLVVVFAFDKFRSYLVGTKVTKGIENQVADHLSRLEVGNEDGNIQLIKGDFPNEQLLVAMTLPWYADIVNFLVSGLLPPELNNQR